MYTALSPIIQPHELLILAQDRSLIIIDASAGAESVLDYNNNHLKDAIYVNLNKDLATIPEDAANGGRHPLPTVEFFAKKLGNWGVSAQSHVIIYDTKNGANAAARLWWMLRATGHLKVQVLNGGLAAAATAGFILSNVIKVPESVDSYPFKHWQLPIATMHEVEKAVVNNDTIIVDVRDAYRYNGESEPIDLVAGHIPGAINIPFTTNLNNNGLFLQAAVLKEKYNKALGNINPDTIIVHCGSGVTACHTLLAIDYAGLPLPKLYVGSWSEWSRNSKKMALNL